MAYSLLNDIQLCLSFANVKYIIYKDFISHKAEILHYTYFYLYLVHSYGRPDMTSLRDTVDKYISLSRSCTVTQYFCHYRVYPCGSSDTTGRV